MSLVSCLCYRARALGGPYLIARNQRQLSDGRVIAALLLVWQARCESGDDHSCPGVVGWWGGGGGGGEKRKREGDLHQCQGKRISVIDCNGCAPGLPMAVALDAVVSKAEQHPS
jgi:hypothetical protein